MIGLLPGQVEVLEMGVVEARALSSPACSEVFTAFDARRPLSIREVALEVERSPASVGEHVGTLVEAGLLIPAGTRRRRARTETLYVHRGLVTRFVLRGQDPAAVEAYLERFAGQMRLATRQHERAQRAVLSDPGFSDFVAYKYEAVTLSRASALRVKAAVAELQALLRSLAEPGTEDGVRVHVSALMLPTTRESQRVLSGEDER